MVGSVGADRPFHRRRPCADRRALDLHEREPDVGECVAHRRRVLAESVAEAFDEAGDGVDGERGLPEIGRLGGQMDGRQLVQTHHVVGDHDFGGHLGQASLRVAERLVRLVERRGGVGPRRVTGGFVAHVRYPTDDN